MTGTKKVAGRFLAAFLFLIWVIAASSLRADPTAGRTGSSNAPPLQSQATFSPTGTPTIGPALLAPDSAPSQADSPGHPYFPANEVKGSSKWHSSMALGVVIPGSAGLQSNYPLGFSGSLGSGYQFTRQFSGWIQFDFDHFTPRGTGETQYNIVCLALLAKWNLTDSSLSPYVFMGPGGSYNEVRSNTAAGYDDYTGQYYFPVNQYEIDLVAEGGLGLSLRLSDSFRLFLQGKMTVNFISPSFAANVLGDSPSFLIPVQTGVELGF